LFCWRGPRLGRQRPRNSLGSNQFRAELANFRRFDFLVAGMWQRSCLILIIGTALAGPALAGPESAEVNLDYVAKRALERAHHPFHSPRADLPKVLRQDNLDYDKYREIEFRHEKAL